MARDESSPASVLMGFPHCPKKESSRSVQERDTDARAMAVKYISEHPDEFKDFLGAGDQDQDEDYNNIEGYLKKMSVDGCWGDNIALRALCDAFKVRLAVLTRRNVEDGELRRPQDRWTWSKIAEDKVVWPWIGLYLAHRHYENLISAADVI